MVLELKDRIGGTICNTHLVGSVSLTKLINTQKLHDAWRKINPNKTEYTYHRNQSNIHSKLDRIYASQNISILNSSILPFQYPDHEALLTEFALRVRTCGPRYWKINNSILDYETFITAFRKFWLGWQQQKQEHKQITTWWEIGKNVF